jgi:glycosyltransferase involved in cell wall biosynthesis
MTPAADIDLCEPGLGAEPGPESLSIVFPAWNEEDLIVRAITAGQDLCRHLRATGQIGDHEIVVVDDASTDGTGKLADELAYEDPALRVIHHDVNRALGGALRTGFTAARGDLVLYTDTDLPFDLLDVEKALRLLRLYQADIVSPYRLDRTAEGPRRFLYSLAYNHLVRLALGLRLRDVNFAFKLVRRRVLDHVDLTSEGSFIDVELLANAQRLGFGIIQFGVDYFPRSRGVSTLSSLTVIRKILAEMGQLAPEIRRRQPLPASVLEARS